MLQHHVANRYRFTDIELAADMNSILIALALMVSGVQQVSGDDHGGDSDQWRVPLQK